MSNLNCITLVKEVEVEATIELDLLDLIYDYVESVEDLTKVVDCVSDPISDKYKETLRENNPTDLIDLICCADAEAVSDVLNCILNQHQKALHQFIAAKQAEIKLALIESAQAMFAELDNVIQSNSLPKP